MSTKIKVRKKTTPTRLLVLLSIVLMVSLSSCNVTRVISNESQYLQKGDTSIVIQTKTIETYDAIKKQ